MSSLFNDFNQPNDNMANLLSQFNQFRSTFSGNPEQQSTPMNNFLNQFNQFKSTFSGNPEQQVKQLLNSGRMSQQQFNQYAETANQLRQLLK